MSETTPRLTSVVVDLHCEAPTRSGYPMGNNFNQPTLERLLEKTVVERGIPLVRGYGACP